MSTGRNIGIILPVHVLRRIVRGQHTWEEGKKYVAAAKQFDLDVVLFTLKHYSPQRKIVRGYVHRRGTWRRWRGPLPLVVHNRIIPQTLGSFHLLRMLTRQVGGRLFNPPVSRDKWDVWRQLAAGGSALSDHLPKTWPLTRGLCKKMPRLIRTHRDVVVKPRHGGLGAGILFVEPLSERPGRYRITSTAGRPRVIGRLALIRLLRRRVALRRYIIQAAVPLVKYEGRRCDMRVPVQRDGEGRWVVLSGTIKSATRHRYLTNIARGGKATAHAHALDTLFGADRAPKIWDEIARLSRAVAERLATTYPNLADLGLDVGIDAAGRPWIIEVNFRDQRLPSKQAGQTDTHNQLYYNPMAYANYLARRSRGKTRRGIN